MNIVLKTERLNLRPVSENDLENVYQLQRLEETAQYNTSKIPENINETKITVGDWIRENNKERTKKFTFAIDLVSNGKFIGLIGINLGKEHYRNAEVWFQLDYRFWNQGFATESLRKIIEFGFEELNLHRIEAGCAVDNIGSYSVLEKVGMLREAHTRKLLPLKSGWSDNYGYAILETDFRKYNNS
ncbi:GNAT family N-acetyltransferase [Epilithonimonas hungarica]|jgi:Acetyltransferases, including N-acetylases of ribosomal proteins|uniref:Protein N-acetyltransferase, RimJ/RimL family n=1 Tax=Epilithonimonas hungarica TaxID=454006 RepID=A0A1G7M6W4_9FLAO|nr:GNAT family protein [Epilithonimonas hungarica]SDF56949.1 Protein N-acetyltransferase, RimJ/RimL family [Epilithonimonas hungarica]